MPKIRPRNRVRFGKRGSLQPDFQLNIIRRIGRVLEIRERDGAILGARAGGAEERAEGIESHHPRAY
jgi:hypothetical protein